MEFTFLVVAVLIGCFIKGLCGFANSIVFLSIAGLHNSGALITPLDLLFNLPMNLAMFLKLRKKANKKLIISLIVFVLIGSVIGALILKKVDDTLLKIIFGFVVVFMGIEMLLNNGKQTNKNPHALQGIIFGLLAGLMCGLFGIGALLAGYISKITPDTESFKGTITAVFLTDGIFRLFLYISLGLLTFDTLKTFLIILPFAMLFLFFGMKCAKIAKEETVKFWINLFLILSGLFLIATNIM